MPIDFDRKQAFIHIPKCGGTTIEARYNLQRKECFFEGKYDAYKINGVNYAPQHLTPQHLSALVTNWSEFNTFCFVRNPLEKMVSEYFQLHTHLYKRPVRFFNEFAFRKWLKAEASQFNMDHTLPQWHYAESCNHIFRLIDMKQTIPLLDEWFDLAPNTPVLNKKQAGAHWTWKGKKSNRSIAASLSKSTKRLIQKIYSVDYDHLKRYF